MDEMKRIVICKHCGKPEYYGDMRWLNELYKWKDLDGKRPTMEEYQEQESEGKDNE